MRSVQQFIDETVQILQEFGENVTQDALGVVIVKDGNIVARGKGSENLINNALLQAIYQTGLSSFEDHELYISNTPNQFITSIVDQAKFGKFYYLIEKDSQYKNKFGFKLSFYPELQSDCNYEEHEVYRMDDLQSGFLSDHNTGSNITHKNDINDHEMKINNTVLRIKRTSKIDLKLFVGQIQRNWDENDVTRLFQKYGEILESQIIRDGKNNNPRGCAFVKFSSMTDAEKAMENLSNVGVEGQDLRIKWADGEAERLGIEPGRVPKLFVGSLPKECNEENLTDVFGYYGHIAELHLNKDQDGRSRGTAIIRYDKTESALLAIRNLNAQAYLMDHDRPIEVRFAERKNLPAQRQQDGGQVMGIPGGKQNKKNYFIEYFDEQGTPYYYNTADKSTSYDQPPQGSLIYDEGCTTHRIQESLKTNLNDIPNTDKVVGPHGANLFIFHLPSDYKDSDLMNLFSRFGKVISSRVITQPDGKSKGYGFVSYDDPQHARAAINSLNGFQLGEKKKLLVRLRDGEQQNKKHLDRIQDADFQAE